MALPRADRRLTGGLSRSGDLRLVPVPGRVDTWGIEQSGGMRVPGTVFASERIASAIESQALHQVANVAHLPGIVVASYAMPDVHWGYGFPIGGLAATDVARGGVVSPGGVGFDISCGVRLLRAGSDRGLAEEAPSAYKDIDAVVASCQRAGLGRPVARLRPVGVVKG